MLAPIWPFKTYKGEVKPPMKSQMAALVATEFRPGHMWWMEVGLGKTGLALAEFEILRREGYVDQMAVFTLNSFKGGWQDEAEAFALRQSGVGIWPDIKKFDDLWAVIMNFEALSGKGHEAIQAWLARGRTYFVVDESQNIKNHNSDRTKKLISLGKDAPFTRPMTGTWGETVMDLWPQLRFAKALDGVNPFVFRNRYAKMGGFMGKKVVGIREDKMDDFGAIMKAHVFEATQAEYLPDLPKGYYTQLRLEMPKVLQGHYREMLADFVTMLGDGSEVVAEMVVTQIVKLQQITTGFIMKDDKVTWLIPPEKSPKILAIKDVLESRGGKLLAFAYHKPAVEGICQALDSWGISHSVIRGGVKQEELKEAKAQFNQDGGTRVMVGQIVAAGAAHTLLGGPNDICYTTMFIENVYSLIKRTQAEGRNRRQGQTKAVEYIDPYMSKTELDMVEALQKKTSLVEAVRAALRG